MTKIIKWELLESIDVSPSKWFPLFKHTVKIGNGKIVDDYFVSKLGNVAMVIPFTRAGEIILVRQYKHGIGEITIEFPAGIIEPDQTPIAAAEAELSQETGLIAGCIEYIGEVVSSPTKNSTRVFGFVAAECTFSVDQDFDDTEEIEIIHSNPSEIDQWIHEGKISGSDCIAIWTKYKMKIEKNPTIRST
jgi:ADP-ribose pyrophosphatase